MTRAGQVLRPHVPRLAALAIVVALYATARQPALLYTDGPGWQDGFSSCVTPCRNCRKLIPDPPVRPSQP